MVMHSGERLEIPLKNLSLSPKNVRKTDRAADIEGMADSIASKGLKQNLVVIPTGKAGHYEVTAGGRRFQALQLLVERKAIKASDKVPCLVEEAAHAVETSLEENIQRVAMNPADELDAYREIMDRAEGSEADRIAHVAKRQGKTVRHVEQRLRLARLAPPILEQLREGKITLDTAKAFASTGDQERQLEVLEVVGDRGHARWVQELINKGSVTNADRRAALVGRSAYEAAGGVVENDLFASAGTERWTDVPLLEKLAMEKLRATAAEIQETEGYQEVVPVTDTHAPYELTRNLHTWYPRVTAKPAGDAGDKIVALEQEQVALGDQLEAAGDYDADEDGRPTDVALAPIWDRYEAIDEEIRNLRNGATEHVVPTEKRARFKRFLVLSSDGKPKLADPWYSDVKIDNEGEPAGRPSATGSGASSTSGLSEALVGELAMQRRDILAVELAREPATALLYAQFVIVDGITSYMKHAFGNRQGSSLQLNRQEISEPVSKHEVEGGKYEHIRASQARASLEWIRDELDWSWCNGLEKGTDRWDGADGQLERFDRFRQLSEEARAAIFAWAVSQSLQPSGGTGRLDRIHDRLGHMLQIDVAAWWRPTKGSYFGRINVDDIKEAIVAIDPNAKPSGKKGELAQLAEDLAGVDSGPGKTWLPAAMLFRQLGEGGDA